MNHKTDMQAALQACVDVLLHDGVPIDPTHPKRIALIAAEAALASRPDAQAKTGATGWKLAMRVMQSDLFDKLDDAERAECDALVRANPYLGRSSTAAAQVDERGAWNIDSRESRSAFRNYDSIAEPVSGKTPWQIWRDACAWQARAAAPQAARDQHEKSDLYKEGYLAGKAAAAAPSPDREQVGEACIAPACHQWDGTDRCTCQRHRTLDTLKRVATALPVLRTMLATEGLGGVEVADEMLSDIRALLGEKADAPPSRECGERQECPHGVDDGACGWCYDEKAASAPTPGEQPQAAEPKGLTEHLYILSANEEAMESAIEAFEGSSEGEGLKSVLYAQKQLCALLSKGAK